MSEIAFVEHPGPRQDATLATPRFVGKYLSITSFKRDGAGVATPVWFVQDAGRLLVQTDAHSGKVKRIRHNRHVMIAPCTATGRLLADPLPARAELLADAELGRVERLMTAKYRIDLVVIKPIRALQARLRRGRPRPRLVILAITPGVSEPTTSSAPLGGAAGPVAITGASGQVGAALQRRLAAFRNQVRPLGRGDDLATAFADAEVSSTWPALRSPASPTPTPPPTWTASRPPRPPWPAPGATGRLLSFASADPRSPNPYLRAKAQAETVLRDSGIPATILRCHHVYGPPEEPGPTARSFLTSNGRTSPSWAAAGSGLPGLP